MSTKHTIARDQDSPLFGFHWCAGIGEPAGLFWLDGRCIIAGLGTRAEDWLLGLGAIPVGTLRFDADPADRRSPVQAVVPVVAVELAEVRGRRNN
jgi:hypothetical protein